MTEDQTRITNTYNYEEQQWIHFSFSRYADWIVYRHQKQIYPSVLFFLLSTHVPFTILTCVYRMRVKFCRQHWLLYYSGLISFSSCEFTRASLHTPKDVLSPISSECNKDGFDPFRVNLFRISEFPKFQSNFLPSQSFLHKWNHVTLSTAGRIQSTFIPYGRSRIAFQPLSPFHRGMYSKCITEFM